MKKIKKLLSHRRKKIRSMQMTISVSFTLLSVCCMCFLGVMLYQQFGRESYSREFQTADQSDCNKSGRLSEKYASYFRCHVL